MVSSGWCCARGRGALRRSVQAALAGEASGPGGGSQVRASARPMAQRYIDDISLTSVAREGLVSGAARTSGRERSAPAEGAPRQGLAGAGRRLKPTPRSNQLFGCQRCCAGLGSDHASRRTPPCAPDAPASSQPGSSRDIQLGTGPRGRPAVLVRSGCAVAGRGELRRRARGGVLRARRGTPPGRSLLADPGPDHALRRRSAVQVARPDP